tara:strand:+ start:260 stop:445 length:186 start_codon:yes stop_codon:yes gene_type:complete
MHPALKNSEVWIGSEGLSDDIYAQINQTETAIPIKVGTTAAKIKIMAAFLLTGVSSSSVNS